MIDWFSAIPALVCSLQGKIIMREDSSEQEKLKEENRQLQIELAELKKNQALERDPKARANDDLSEIIFKAICDHAFHLAGIVDLNGVLRHANRITIEYICQAPSQIIGKPIWTAPGWTPSVAEQKKLQEGIQRAVLGEFVQFETKLAGADGALYEIEFTLKPAHDEKGQVFCLILEAWDITERKKTETALREKTDELDRYFTNALDLLCIADTDGHFRRLNKEWESALGYSVKDLEGKQFLDYVHPDDLESTRQAVSQLGAQREILNFVNRYRRKDGSYRWIEWRSIPAGNLIYAAARDVTENKRMEEALRESEGLFRTIVTNSQPIIFMIDKEGKFVLSEGRMLSSLGLKPGQVVGQSAFEMYRNFPAIINGLEAALEGLHCEDIIDVGGVVFDIFFSPHRDSHGKVIGILGMAVDITERRQVEEALRKSERSIRSIIESIPIGMHFYRLESNGHLVFTGANPAADKILGVDNYRFVGKTVEEAFPELLNTEVPQRYRETAANGTPWQAEQISYHEGSIHGAFEVSAFQIGPSRMAAAFSDITVRKRAEEALRASEERFKRLVQNSNDLIIVSDEKGIQTAISGPLEKMLGYSPEELMGTSVFDRIHPDDLEIVLKIFTEAVQEPAATRRVEYRYRHKNGSWSAMETVGSNLLHDPIVKGIVLNIREITERNKLQEQLQQAMKMEAVGRLSGGIAHDFNNLLTTIAGNVELAKMDLNPSDPLRQNLEEVYKAAQSAASLTRQLLAFSRRQIIEPKVLDLNDLVSKLQKMLGRLIGEDISLQTVLAKDLGSARVDPGQFEQVLVNLAVNARDAMPDGGELLIETKNVELDELYCLHHPHVHPGNFVLLAVSDTGHGMGEEVKQHLFEPFFTTKPKGRGTGLGLATIFGAVKQARGSIEVYSELGKGTTFKIYLPQIAEKAEKLIQEKPAVGLPRGDETVLLVEDDVSVRDLALMVLKRLGYKVLHAINGGEAFLTLENYQGRVDLLMTDVVMPGINGRELAQKLLKLQPGMKVLFTSGYTENVIVHHGVVEENLNFIGKPYSLQELAKKIREVLDAKPD
jgi:two-component system, cell cycle sensor histidine kinase and response regulator CckA